MADEYIDILDEKGEPTNTTVLKSEAHRLGLFHASVHIWFYTKEKEILLQKRAHQKDTFPDLWDISVAGHIASGEKPKNAAIREIQEEIGLHVTNNDLELIGTRISKKQPKLNFYDHELHYIYLTKFNSNIDKLQLQQEEVSEVSLLPITMLKNHLADTEKSKLYVPHDHSYYLFILNEIINRLQ
ncbi:NUDIX hydrolase [Aquimarina algicola]|uniref:NUDIX domain-containing protein n=1 Tax=Aquimarina algicola TaxID=2589995 RepID=A0A504J8D8_9FLAO|nr:NUDIX domain-containing protein [Aquimarina algicola]TPN82451.1 NUDIX domain-containing protein [Aquimarina algicola]